MEMDSLELVPGRYIGEGNPTFVIAEIGQNHNGKYSINLKPFSLNLIFSFSNICLILIHNISGDLNTAKELILKAKECGADCVKFQKSR